MPFYHGTINSDDNFPSMNEGGAGKILSSVRVDLFLAIRGSVSRLGHLLSDRSCGIHPS